MKRTYRKVANAMHSLAPILRWLFSNRVLGSFRFGLTLFGLLGAVIAFDYVRPSIEVAARLEKPIAVLNIKAYLESPNLSSAAKSCIPTQQIPGYVIYYHGGRSWTEKEAAEFKAAFLGANHPVDKTPAWSDWSRYTAGYGKSIPAQDYFSVPGQNPFVYPDTFVEMLRARYGVDMVPTSHQGVTQPYDAIDPCLSRLKGPERDWAYLALGKAHVIWNSIVLKNPSPYPASEVLLYIERPNRGALEIVQEALKAEGGSIINNVANTYFVIRFPLIKAGAEKLVIMRGGYRPVADDEIRVESITQRGPSLRILTWGIVLVLLLTALHYKYGSD